MNIRTAESACLRAMARHKQWLERFLQRWMEPLNDQMMLMAWEAIPEEVKVALAAQNPQQFAEVAERMEQIKRGG